MKRKGGGGMRWLPARRQTAWWWIAGAIGLGLFAAFGLGARFLLPHAEPKYLFIALFGLATGLVIAGLGWLGARRFFLLSTIGLVVGVASMLTNFSGSTGWEDLVGLLSMQAFLAAGVVAGVVVELAYWVYKLLKGRGQ
jgi:hypothetical protein